MKRLRKKLIDKVFAKIKNYDYLLYDGLEIKWFEERHYRIITQKYSTGSIRKIINTINSDYIYRNCLNIKLLREILDIIYDKKPFVKIEKDTKTKVG